MPGFEDSAFLIVLALLLFGPKKLPQLARQAGKLMSDFRRASNEFRTQMEEELRISEQADRQKKVAAIETAAPAAPAIDPYPGIEQPQPSTAPDSDSDTQRMSRIRIPTWSTPHTIPRSPRLISPRPPLSRSTTPSPSRPPAVSALCLRPPDCPSPTPLPPPATPAPSPTTRRRLTPNPTAQSRPPPSPLNQPFSRPANSEYETETLHG